MNKNSQKKWAVTWSWSLKNVSISRNGGCSYCAQFIKNLYLYY